MYGRDMSLFNTLMKVVNLNVLSTHVIDYALYESKPETPIEKAALAVILLTAMEKGLVSRDDEEVVERLKTLGVKIRDKECCDNGGDNLSDRVKTVMVEVVDIDGKLETVIMTASDAEIYEGGIKVYDPWLDDVVVLKKGEKVKVSKNVARILEEHNVVKTQYA